MLTTVGAGAYMYLYDIDNTLSATVLSPINVKWLKCLLFLVRIDDNN